MEDRCPHLSKSPCKIGVQLPREGAAGVAVLVRDEALERGERRDSRDGAPSELKRGGGRMFTLRAGVWTDVNHADSLRVTTIAPFSRAYFELVAARPALREALAVGLVVPVERRLRPEPGDARRARGCSVSREEHRGADATADAHGLYSRFGYEPLPEPARWMWRP